MWKFNGRDTVRLIAYLLPHLEWNWCCPLSNVLFCLCIMHWSHFNKMVCSIPGCYFISFITDVVILRRLVFNIFQIKLLKSTRRTCSGLMVETKSVGSYRFIWNTSGYLCKSIFMRTRIVEVLFFVDSMNRSSTSFHLILIDPLYEFNGMCPGPLVLGYVFEKNIFWKFPGVLFWPCAHFPCSIFCARASF